MVPTQSSTPTSPMIITVEADFTGASTDNVVTLASFGSDVVLVTVDDLVNTSVYTIESNGDDIGMTCPPNGGIQFPAGSTTFPIPLNGIDTAVVICGGADVIGVCYHVFNETAIGGAGDMSVSILQQQTVCNFLNLFF